MNDRFELIWIAHRCSVLDKELNIRCIWEKGKFNDTQEFITAEDLNCSAQELAKAMRELGDWLRENHYDLLF